MDEIFVNINDLPFYTTDADGTDHINVAAANVGDGSRALKIDQSGLWLGADKWADAPFRVDMAGNATMSSISLSGYVEDTGGQYVSSSSGARVLIYPSSEIGFQAVDASANNVFLVYVGGTDVGDVVIGDYSGGTGILWDNSAGDLIIKGDMTAGNISGVTITGSDISTGTTGTRVSMSANGDTISIYDSGNDLGMQLSLVSSTQAKMASGDNRVLTFTSDNAPFYFISDTGDNQSALFNFGSTDVPTLLPMYVEYDDGSDYTDVVFQADVLDFESRSYPDPIELNVWGDLYVESSLTVDGDFGMSGNLTGVANLNMSGYLYTPTFIRLYPNTGTPTPSASGNLFYYTDGGGNFYWRSINNATLYQFDQHTP